ncbi:hypothetical protein MVEN_02253600 [Mycena venus]|uniref:Uncharacterized protein n=1 Tax=Mycena venus TaxID=2733690 RepID=A0A8H7CEV2_9AGAR|nr:hypothetical protein MVEN_02253600 [Mycena venus]
MERQTAATFSHTEDAAPPPPTAEIEGGTDGGGDESDEEGQPPSGKRALKKGRSIASVGKEPKKLRAGTKEWIKQAYEEKQAKMEAYVETLVAQINDAKQTADDAREEIGTLRDRIAILEDDIDFLLRQRQSRYSTGSSSGSESGRSEHSVEGALKRKASDVLEPEAKRPRRGRSHSRDLRGRSQSHERRSPSRSQESRRSRSRSQSRRERSYSREQRQHAYSRQEREEGEVVDKRAPSQGKPLMDRLSDAPPAPPPPPARAPYAAQEPVAGPSKEQTPRNLSGHGSARGGNRGSPLRGGAPQYQGGLGQRGGRGGQPTRGGNGKGKGRGGTHQHGAFNAPPPPPAHRAPPPPPPPPPPEPRYPIGGANVVIGPVRWVEKQTRNGLKNFVAMMEEKGHKPPMPTRVSEPLVSDPQYVMATFSGRREGGEFARIWNEWKKGGERLQCHEGSMP